MTGFPAFWNYSPMVRSLSHELERIRQLSASQLLNIEVIVWARIGLEFDLHERRSGTAKGDGEPRSTISSFLRTLDYSLPRTRGARWKIAARAFDDA
jgi:hypothetical protein